MEDSSLQKKERDFKEVIKIEEMPAFLELVKEIMMLLNGDEYLDCKGVIEGNVKSLARQIRNIMKKEKCDVERAMEVLWGKFQN